MKAIISGTIDDNRIISKRLSGTTDMIPVRGMVLQDGLQCTLTGKFKSENTPDRHVNLFFLAEEKSGYEVSSQDENYVELNGYVCKSPISRTTPLGRHITDLLVAVNDEPFESDYLPCIVWGECPDLKIGDYVEIEGRIQSRMYHGNKTAYEISVSKILTKQ